MALPAKRQGCLGPSLAVGGMLVALLAAGLLFAPPVQTAARTVLLLPELIELPIRPLSALAPQPRRVTVSYGVPADRMDIYLPADAAPVAASAPVAARLPGVVLALGVHPQPIDHPDVVRLATAISRLGVVVGVPDSTALRQTRVTPAEPAHLADAVLVLAGRPEVDRARVGLAGFSAGASIALIAAADPRLHGSLHFVSAFGGYADARLLLVDVATRTMVLDGQVRPWSPDAGIRHDVLGLFLGLIEPAAVREQLYDVLLPVVTAEGPPGGPDGALLARLSGDAAAAYRLFTAPDRPTARTAVESLSPALRRQLADISPVDFAASIRAPVLLMHGEADRAIPFSHAVLLRDALPAGSVARFTRFGRFEHGQPGRQGLTLEDLPDLWELTLHLHAVVAAATE